MYVWNHPIDLGFAVNDLNSWPKLALRIWKLDSSNKIDCCNFFISIKAKIKNLFIFIKKLVAYGCITLPMKNGYNKIVC